MFAALAFIRQYAAIFKYIGIALAVLALVVGAIHTKNVYDDGKREEGAAPVRKDLNLLTAQVVAQKKQAAELLATKIAENAALKAASDKQAKDSENDYQKRIADIRARANAAGGVHLYDPAGRGKSCSGPGQTAKDGTGTTEGSAAPGQLSDELSAFLVAEAKRADEISVYAESCSGFVNQK